MASRTLLPKKFKVLFLFTFLFIFSLIKAQTDFRPGYIITLKGDTLEGEIDYRGDVLMGSVCAFKTKGINKKIKYTANDILAYRFTEDKFYVSKTLNGKNVFLEFLIKGEINIYYRRDHNGDHYYIEKAGIGMTELTYEEGKIHKGDNTYLFKYTKHTGLLYTYMGDAPEIKSRISNFTMPGHRNLIKLAANYHHNVCKDESCIIYEKRPPSFNVNIEVIGGVVNYYHQSDAFDDKKYFQGGFLAQIGIPRLNEKLYFRIGILHSTVKYKYEYAITDYGILPDQSTYPLFTKVKGSKKTLYKFPFQIAYISPRGRIRPKVGYGINFHKPFYQSVSVISGLNIKLYNSISCEVNYDLEFTPHHLFLMLPNKTLSQFISTGLLIKI